MNGDLFLILIIIFVICLFILFARIFWMWHKILKKRQKDESSEKIVSKKLTPKYQLMYGSSYLIVEDGTGDGLQQGFKILRANLQKGANAIVVTRTYPDKVMNKFRLDNVPMLWLSRTEGRRKDAKASGADFKVIEPTKLGMLLDEIKEHIHTQDDSIVMFDGLEYLTVHNEFSRVLKFLHGLEDEIALHRSRLIVAINPKALDDKDRVLLEKEFKILSFSK